MVMTFQTKIQTKSKLGEFMEFYFLSNYKANVFGEKKLVQNYARHFQNSTS
jgi:hypothetical protein